MTTGVSAGMMSEKVIGFDPQFGNVRFLWWQRQDSNLTFHPWTCEPWYTPAAKAPVFCGRFYFWLFAPPRRAKTYFDLKNTHHRTALKR